MTGLSVEYILKHDSKPAHCHTGPRADRLAELENMQYAGQYAERGYDQPAKGILFANWNYFSKEVACILERVGYELEWSDEWSQCDECTKAVRTSPDGHGWQPFYILDDSSLVCLSCVDWPDHLERVEDTTKGVMSACDPSKFGYRLISESGQYQTGLHIGQDDKPADILAKCKAAGQTGIVFRVSDKGQFDVTWEVWQRIPEPDETEATDEN
jgi:hypothetical protein